MENQKINKRGLVEVDFNGYVRQILPNQGQEHYHVGSLHMYKPHSSIAPQLCMVTKVLPDNWVEITLYQHDCQVGDISYGLLDGTITTGIENLVPIQLPPGIHITPCLPDQHEDATLEDMINTTEKSLGHFLPPKFTSHIRGLARIIYNVSQSNLNALQREKDLKLKIVALEEELYGDNYQLNLFKEDL